MQGDQHVKGPGGRRIDVAGLEREATDPACLGGCIAEFNQLTAGLDAGDIGPRGKVCGGGEGQVALARPHVCNAQFAPVIKSRLCSE
jgi:hypothetical protein